MIIRIESSHGNTLISGKQMPFNDLNRTVKEIWSEHDEKDFVEIFCSVYGYIVLPYTEGYAAYYVDLEAHVVIVPTHSFPKTIDGARVLFHTDRGKFDPVYYVGGSIADIVSYLAVCKYDNDNDNVYYLFHLNDDLEVVADEIYDSIEQCKKLAGSRAVVWHENK